MDRDSGLISEEDKFVIRTNYTSICNNIDPTTLIATLKGHSVLTQQDVDHLQKLENAEKKTEYLIFKILLQNGTNEILINFRKALENIGNDKLLELLPVGMLFPTESDVLKNQDAEASPATYDTADASSKPEVPELPTDVADNDFDCDEGEEILRAAGPMSSLTKSLRKLSMKKKKKVEKSADHEVHQQDTKPQDVHEVELVREAIPQRPPPRVQQDDVKVITKFSDAFLAYGCKDSTLEHGCGLCVVFSFFTGDLQGYLHDVQALQRFFRGKLGYEVLSGDRYQNLTQEELFTKIGEVRRLIEDKKYFDRLVVVVLTHGQPDGLMTCGDKDGMVPEQHKVVYDNYAEGYRETQYVTTSTKVEEIVDCFKHDTIYSLKDMPKLFLIQACRGSDVVKAANKASTHEDIVDGQVDTSRLLFQRQSPIDGDIMICQSTTENHSSLVNPYEGSWFIKQTIEVFEKHYKTEHVADMMTVVNLAVAELRGKISHKDGTSTKAVQMPCVISTFRKRFYLYNKSHNSGFMSNKVILPSVNSQPYVIYPRLDSQPPYQNQARNDGRYRNQEQSTQQYPNNNPNQYQSDTQHQQQQREAHNQQRQNRSDNQQQQQYGADERIQHSTSQHSTQPYNTGPGGMHGGSAGFSNPNR